MRTTAKEWEKKILDRLPKNGSNYTGIEAEGRFYNGYLGEFALGQALRDHGVKAIYWPRTNGLSNREDFTLFIASGLPKSVDIKTASPKAYNKNKLLVNEKQHKKVPFEIYIGANHDNEYVYIYGYTMIGNMNYKEDGFTKQNEPTYWLELSHLYSIEHLLKVAQKGEMMVK